MSQPRAHAGGHGITLLQELMRAAGRYHYVPFLACLISTLTQHRCPRRAGTETLQGFVNQGNQTLQLTLPGADGTSHTDGPLVGATFVSACSDRIETCLQCCWVHGSVSRSVTCPCSKAARRVPYQPYA